MKKLLLIPVLFLLFSCHEDEDPTHTLTIAMVQDSNATLRSFVHTGFYSDYKNWSAGGSDVGEQVINYDMKGDQPIVFTLWNTDKYAMVGITFSVPGRKDISFVRHFDQRDMIHHMIYNNGDKDAAQALYDGIRDMPNTYAFRVNF